MNMKVQLKWKDGDIWRETRVEVAYSGNHNYWFKHNGAIYVFPTLNNSKQVLVKTSKGPWARAGSITRNGILLR
jgi:hypothetical protein